MNWYSLAAGSGLQKHMAKFANKQITKPHFRVVCPACFGNNDGKDPLGPGSYWTPRWNAVVSMLCTINKFYFQRNNSHNSDGFRTKIYRLDKAIMADPPKEHSWAFNYQSDAGEQVLVKALSEPVMLCDMLPTDRQFLELMEDYEPDVDYSKGEKYLWNGQEVFLYPNYQTKKLEIAKKNEGWSFSVIGSLSSAQEFESWVSQAKLLDSEWTGMIEYFMQDMGWMKYHDSIG